MIKYRRFDNSPDCFEMIFLDLEDMKERKEHVHISEIRRFYGHRPNEALFYTDSELIKFFTYRAQLLGTRGEYIKKKARNRGRIPNTRRIGKPNSPGEGGE